jgi:type VII secretion integral membrane protein EccD
MTVPIGLARLTVSTPRRRIDVALPEEVPVAELLPHLLRHAGDSAADDGEQHGGWILRTTGGTPLDPLRSLLNQGVRDGEVLHLVPRRTEWPELSYDDVVEVIAGGARRTGARWGAAATRRTTLAVVAILLCAGAAVPWLAPAHATAGAAAIGFAVLLILAGTLLARAAGDAVAGAVLAACGLPYALLGAVAVTAGPQWTLVGLPGMLGPAGLLLCAILGQAGTVALARLFVAASTVALCGLLAGVLSASGMSPAGAVGIALTVAVGLLPGYPLLATWLGRVPVPALPQRPEEMLADRPAVPRPAVFAAVARSYELLTGFLLGASVTGLLAIGFLVWRGGTTGRLLAACAAIALLLRARLFPGARQRVPLLAGGAAGLLWLGAAVLAADRLSPAATLGVTGMLAAAVLVAGLRYATAPPSPRLGRLADAADVLVILALVPLACGVAGLYGAVQAAGASVG